MHTVTYYKVILYSCHL